MLPFRTLDGPQEGESAMTTDHIELIWDRDCLGTAQTASGSRLDVGATGHWTAEQLLMAAAESAVMTSFLALAGEEGLEVLGYMSSAGTEGAAGPGAAMRVLVRPCIVVAGEPDAASAEAMMARALDRSPVARALKGVLLVDPQVVAIDSP